MTEPVVCPHCNSDNLEADRLDSGGGELWRNVTCLACGFEWIETFVFKSWEPAEQQADEFLIRDMAPIP